jgi:hypothetical protein
LIACSDGFEFGLARGRPSGAKSMKYLVIATAIVAGSPIVLTDSSIAQMTQ